MFTCKWSFMSKRKRRQKEYKSKESEFLNDFLDCFLVITTPKSTEITFSSWKIRKIILTRGNFSETKIIKKTKYGRVEEKLELFNKDTTAYLYSRPGTRSKGKFVSKFIFTHKQP